MGVIKRNGNTYGGGGGASADGKAESSAIAPVFDDTETYAAGDRVTYEDELYVFNKAHTGAWDSADADKTDVDSEIPDKLTSQQMQEIKDAFVVDSPRNGYPVLFDETGAEHFVGWYKYANGTKKPVYQKTMSVGTTTWAANTWTNLNCTNFPSTIEKLVDASIHRSNDSDDDTIAIPATMTCSIGNVKDFWVYSYYAVANITKVTMKYTKTTDTPV